MAIPKINKQDILKALQYIDERSIKSVPAQSRYMASSLTVPGYGKNTSIH